MLALLVACATHDPGTQPGPVDQPDLPDTAVWSISPAYPTTLDELTLVGGELSDLERGSLVWQVDGLNLSIGASLPPLTAHKGERVSAILADRTLATVTIGDAPPSVSPIRAVREAEYLDGIAGCDVDISDVDGDLVTVGATWTRNGIPMVATTTHDGAWQSRVQLDFADHGAALVCTFEVSTLDTTAQTSLDWIVERIPDFGLIDMRPAGPFPTGCRLDSFPMEGDEWWGDTRPREASLTQPFAFSATEVTEGAWFQVLGDPIRVGAQHPEIDHTWSEMAVFLNALSDRSGLERCYDCTAAGGQTSCTGRYDVYKCTGFRMPTSAEYFYVAYSGGQFYADLPDGDMVTGMVELPDAFNASCWTTTLTSGRSPFDLFWFCANLTERFSGEVRRFPPTVWGVYDILGNAIEAMHECAAPPPSGVDPLGPAICGSGTGRGGKTGAVKLCTVTPFQHTSDSGIASFRVVRTIFESTVP